MIQKIATFILGVLASFLLAELALRPWPPRLESMWALRHPAHHVLDDALILSRPRIRDPKTYSFVTTGRPTVFALGDSFTAGYPVHETQSYPVQLGGLLEKAGVPSNVLNLGLGDSGPDQQLVLLQRYALPRARPNILIWQFYANDLWDSFSKALFTVQAGKLKPVPATENWLYRRQLLYDRFPFPVVFKRNSRFVQYFLAAIQPEEWRGFSRPYAHYSDEWALTKIDLELQEMQRLEREQGFQLYIALVAPQMIYINDTSMKLPHIGPGYQHLYKLLSSHPRFIYIYFNQRGDPGWRDLFVGSERDSNAFGDRHFSEKGYALMARRIADHLLSDGASRQAGRLENSSSEIGSAQQ